MLEALRQGMGRHQRRAFWEATIAVCALVAAPEGKVSFATRVRIDHILDSLPDLKIFDTNEFVETFDRYVDEFRVNPKKARARALDVARKGAGDDEESELLARIAFAVADIENTSDAATLQQIEALCGELGVDSKVVLARSMENAPAPAVVPQPEPVVEAKPEPEPEPEPEPAPAPAPAPEETSIDDTAEDQPEMTEEHVTAPDSEPAAGAPAGNGSAEAPHDGGAPATPSMAPTGESSTADLSQQLQVDGTRAVTALCGRTKSGALEALRIYENDQLAAADCALSEKIAQEKFWLSPVPLFPAASGAQSRDGGGSAPIHVMCLSRPDGSVEALRAFEDGDQANADLEFFSNLSNDKMWVSVVQFKTVT